MKKDRKRKRKGVDLTSSSRPFHSMYCMYDHTYKLHKIILLCTEVCLCGGIWVTNGLRVTILSCLWFTIISSSFICLPATFDIVWFTLWSATCLSSKCTTPPWIFSSNLTLVLSWGQKWCMVTGVWKVTSTKSVPVTCLFYLSENQKQISQSKEKKIKNLVLIFPKPNTSYFQVVLETTAFMSLCLCAFQLLVLQWSHALVDWDL